MELIWLDSNIAFNDKVKMVGGGISFLFLMYNIYFRGKQVGLPEYISYNKSGYRVEVHF